MSSQMLASFFGVGTALRLERYACTTERKQQTSTPAIHGTSLYSFFITHETVQHPGVLIL